MKHVAARRLAAVAVMAGLSVYGGIIFLRASSAATFVVSAEAETAALAGNAAKVTDSQAMDNAAIGFGTETFTYTSSEKPERTVVSDKQGNWVATFTKRARTVSMRGPERSFSETDARVDSTVWVRLYPQPFDGTVDEAWLRRSLMDRSPDVFQVAMQYIAGAPEVTDDNKLVIAGDASYGPLQPDGSRAEGADFNDFIGTNWKYADQVDAAEPAQIRSLDCSGFIRMVFGYRHGLSLGYAPSSTAIPRRSFEILQDAPGIITIPDSGDRVNDVSQVEPGDVLFFDADEGDGKQIDHVGIYIGKDTAGHNRFISSRKSADGPTIGDLRGASILDGTGLYARSFQAARRF